MTELIFLIEEALEGGYTARALGESIFTEAETMEELRVNIKEAVDCYYNDNDEKKPKLIRLHLVKEELITL
jgi:predicted RNase H-like HicB family nuclease